MQESHRCAEVTELAYKTGELDLEYFKKNGFEKKVCTSCQRHFWTMDKSRDTCGDAPCDSYSFIGKSPVPRPYTLKEVRELFLDFFRNDHKILDPYPVVPRWRDDVLLVNASIYNFQPHVTSGRVKPPGNPLAMSQPSIRMVDTDLVGETGRHLTQFEMMCHDAFNTPSNFVYWKEETVEKCQNFLTQALGLEPSLITYKEKPWSGGGNGGNALEVLVSGLEVATLVFMDMIADPEGEVEIDGNMYSKMDMMIVDTGYGLDRMVWLSNGTPTIYQAVMQYAISDIVEKSGINSWNPDILSRLSRISAMFEPFDRNRVLQLVHKELEEAGSAVPFPELEGEFETAKSVYILADHTKTLMILFSDYVIPSNVKVGYLARLLLRRALRAKTECGYRGSLFDLIQLHHSHMEGIISNFPESFIREALEEEEAKYSELEKKAENLVLRLFDKKKKLSTKDLLTLYDSSGIIPEITARIVKEKRGVSIEIPGDFNFLITELHEKQAPRKVAERSYPDLYTRPLYYDDTSIKEFNALVLYSKDRQIITNQTAFYPEGGGQPTDLGYFTYRGRKVGMLGAEKHGRAIVHNVESEIPEHSRIIGAIDYQRRRRLMVHHSATHLLLGVLREVLGEHVWQSGVQKGVDRSRIDVTHFRKPTGEQLKKIEKKCLQYILEGRQVTVRNVEWNNALSKYGFRLFEGGVPDGKSIRVVEIQGVDAEGCGGTHVKSTSELGFIKILKVDSIQEGIQRFTFAAGEAALEYVQEIYSNEQQIENELSVGPEKVRESFSKLRDENIELKKERDRRIKESVEIALNSPETFISDGIEVTLISGSFGDSEVKGIISALFSQKKELALLNNSVKGSTELRVITSGLDARKVVECFGKALGPDSGGTARHAWAKGNVSLDVRLIKEIFNNCRLRSS